MYQRHGALIRLLLVEELILDGIHVDKVAHARARVPTDVVRIHVDLPQEFDHLVLVCAVGLRAGRRSCDVCGRLLLVAVCSRDIDGGEGEAGRDLEEAGLLQGLHADEGAGGHGGEGFGGMVDELHHNLRAVRGAGGVGRVPQRRLTRASTCTALMGESLRESAILSDLRSCVVLLDGGAAEGGRRVVALKFASAVCQDYTLVHNKYSE